LDITRAAGCAVTGQNSDGNHGTAAKDVEEYAEESEDFLQTSLVAVDVYRQTSAYLSAKEASQQDSEDGV
jgi:hypothetical protein